MTTPRPVRGYRDLIVWQKATALRREVHLIVVALPREARFELGAQIERAALSIPSNIAEGHARLQRKDYRQYLSIARGSAAELETQLLALSEDYPALHAQIGHAVGLRHEVARMLSAIIKKLESHQTGAGRVR